MVALKIGSVRSGCVEGGAPSVGLLEIDETHVGARYIVKNQ